MTPFTREKRFKTRSVNGTLAIAATIAVFAPISTQAAWLLVPYLAWVSFAGVLNLSIWQLNRAPA